MNIDTYIRQLNPAPRGGPRDADLDDAQMIFDRVTQKISVSRRRPRALHAVLMLASVTLIGLLALGLIRSSPAGTKSPHADAAVLRLDSYRLRLPSNYRLTATTNSNCSAVATKVAATNTPTPPTSAPSGMSAIRVTTPVYASQVATQANAEGGCITLGLTPPYTPTATDPDPTALTSWPNQQAVQVGSYEGFEGTWSPPFTSSSADALTLEGLRVIVPLAGGQDQDLIVIGRGLSQSALVSVVANGLSVASDSSTSGTSGTTGTP